MCSARQQAEMSSQSSALVVQRLIWSWLLTFTMDLSYIVEPTRWPRLDLEESISDVWDLPKGWMHFPPCSRSLPASSTHLLDCNGVSLRLIRMVSITLSYGGVFWTLYWLSCWGQIGNNTKCHISEFENWIMFWMSNWIQRYIPDIEFNSVQYFRNLELEHVLRCSGLFGTIIVMSCIFLL